MSKRYPRARWVLPANLYPGASRCFGVRIPDEPQYIAAWRGAIDWLTWSKAWQDDPDHTAHEVAVIMGEFIDGTVDLPCGAIEEPRFFMRLDDNDPDLTNTNLYDVGDERDLTFKVRAWAAYADTPDPFSPLHMAFDFTQYEGALKVGVRIVQMMIHQGPAGSLVPLILHWWDCSGVAHHEETTNQHITKIDWPDVTQIGVTRFYIEARNPVSLFVTAKAIPECVAP